MTNDTPSNFLARNQATYNRSTRDHWDHFADHRRQVTDLLAPGQLVTGGRLCVLGAGNCNDLELPHLLSIFDRITLVDIDAAALTAAAQRQNVESHERLVLRGGVDLTGASAAMADWPRRKPSGDELDRCLRSIATAPLPAVGGPFDMILSPCLLSQICLYATDALGSSHPRAADLRKAIRRQHLRQLVEWLSPGGTGILVVDLAQAAKVGSLLTSHADRLSEVASRTVGRAQHFPGLDPDTLRDELQNEPLLKGLLSDVRQTPPWMWTLGPKKSFLVYALRFRRSKAALL
ncbi:hypothetical protein [Humisphaera borealis]|uniref:Uncharacterized protein n=1 Tax=Humisphaera borealis TaxID=2807512 RepID=A0A7M2WWR8_9BACT|nr:hypothetical protein [Humisphaera borealis]QOV89839.1 hypothetical protein IPV69_00240 [Humisphaera borealis]